MKNQFKFRSGFRSSKVDPELAAIEIANIADSNNGILTPIVLVENSQNESSPLFDYFEWDDEKCGENWRKQQASQLIRALVVVTEGEKQSNVYHLTYDEVDEQKVTYYIKSDDLAGNELLIANARKLIMKHINGLERSLDELSQLSGKNNHKAQSAIFSLKEAIGV